MCVHWGEKRSVCVLLSMFFGQLLFYTSIYMEINTQDAARLPNKMNCPTSPKMRNCYFKANYKLSKSLRYIKLVCFE